MHLNLFGGGALLHVLVPLVGLASPAEAQLNAMFTGEYPIDESAIDIGRTPNGKWGVVRAQEGDFAEITVWSLTTPSTTPALAVQSLGGVTRSPAGDVNFPSDLVKVVNGRAVCVGSRANNFIRENETYVDILDLSGGTPSVLAQHVFLSGATQNLESGHVNDVAITPNRRHAVVNHKNTVLMFDMATGALDVPPIVLEPTSGEWRDPVGCVDSVALANDVAVVITGYTDASGNKQTWVYMIEIPSGVISLRHQLLASHDGQFAPHDLRLTPDKAMAVVTANNALAFFNVNGRAFERELKQDGLVRQWGEMVDSVACSDQAAAVIANDTSSGTAVWNLQIWDLDNGGGAVPFLIADYTDTGSETNRAHDVAIGPPLTTISGGTGPRAAGVRTESQVVVVQNVEGTPTMTALAVPSSSNPLINPLPYDWDGPFVSDSVVIGDPFIAEGPIEGGGGSIHQYVVTIGTAVGVPSMPLTRGYAQFVDVALVTPALTERILKRSDGSATTIDCAPVDLRRTTLGDGVFIRSLCPSPTNSIEPAVSLFAFNPLKLRTTLGATGHACFSMDSMIVTATEALSTCEMGGNSFLHHASY